jgi:hypothetical protein
VPVGRPALRASSFLIPEGDGLVPKYGIFEAVRDKAKAMGL